MKKRKPRVNPTKTDADNPELTKADFAPMRPAVEVMGERFMRMIRGAPKAQKVRVTTRRSK
jgi:hypothetical protein